MPLRLYFKHCLFYLSYHNNTDCLSSTQRKTLGGKLYLEELAKKHTLHNPKAFYWHISKSGIFHIIFFLIHTRNRHFAQRYFISTTEIHIFLLLFSFSSQFFWSFCRCFSCTTGSVCWWRPGAGNFKLSSPNPTRVTREGIVVGCLQHPGTYMQRCHS